MTDSTSESKGSTISGLDHLSMIPDEVFGVLRRTGVAAEQEYRLSLRNRWAPALVVLFAGFSFLVVGFGGTSAGPRRVEAIIVSLTGLATYLVPLASFAFGYDAIVGADEEGWLDVVFALPVARGTVVLGAYLGRALALGGAVAIGFGVSGIVLFALVPSNFALYARFLLGAVLTALSFLAVAILISAVAKEKTHGLGLVLLAWVWFVLLHDLVAITIVAAFQLPKIILTGFVLANPADCFRVLVLSGATTSGGMTAALATANLSVPLLVLGLLAWCLGPIALAGRLVNRRSV